MSSSDEPNDAVLEVLAGEEGRRLRRPSLLMADVDDDSSKRMLELLLTCRCCCDDDSVFVAADSVVVGFNDNACSSCAIAEDRKPGSVLVVAGMVSYVVGVGVGIGLDSIRTDSIQ